MRVAQLLNGNEKGLSMQDGFCSHVTKLILELRRYSGRLEAAFSFLPCATRAQIIFQALLFQPERVPGT